jgi:hypothetical protein
MSVHEGIVVMNKINILFSVIVLLSTCPIVADNYFFGSSDSKQQDESLNNDLPNQTADGIMSDLEKLEKLKESAQSKNIDSEVQKPKLKVPEKYRIETIIRRFSQLPVPEKLKNKIESAHEAKFFYAALALLEHMTVNGVTISDSLQALPDIAKQDMDSLQKYSNIILDAYVDALWEAHRTAGYNDPIHDVIKVIIEDIAKPAKIELQALTHKKGFFYYFNPAIWVGIQGR